MLILGAETGPGRRMDVRIRNGQVITLARQLEPRRGEACLSAHGCCLIPSLQDHHIHLLALAAARTSVECGPPNVTSERALRDQLARVVSARPVILRGVGYHESVAGDIDAAFLDTVCGEVPVKIQHRSGRLWVLNSPAQAWLPPPESWPAGAEKDVLGRPTGRFYHLDDWLRRYLPGDTSSLQSVSRELASYGVTGVTDAGPDNDHSTLRLLEEAQTKGVLRQRVFLMGRPDLPAHDTPLLRRGPVKIYLKEPALPDFDCLRETIVRAHASARNVAFHCVTRAELHFALTALAETGSIGGDRIEHASVADDAAIARIAELGVTVVTQPHFLSERGDQYLRQVAQEELPMLYRGVSFLRAGVMLAAGSDAPFGHPDPWRAMRASIERRTGLGSVMQSSEKLDARQALGLFLGREDNPGQLRRIAPGVRADLCLLKGCWRDLLGDPHSERVQLTVRGGETIWSVASLRP